VLAVYHESHLDDTRPASQERMRERRRELEAILGGIEAERADVRRPAPLPPRGRDDYRRRTRRALSDVTCKKELSHLRAALRFAKVNVRKGRITLPDLPGFKAGARDIPLTDEIRALLPPRRIEGAALVFEEPEGGSAYHGLGQGWTRRAARRHIRRCGCTIFGTRSRPSWTRSGTGRH
jgi:hypothetical protein